MQPLAKVDDETAAYILETRRQFEDLRQVAAQLAGFLVLNASGANTASPDHPMLASAAELYRDAADRVQGARPGRRALPHHRLLLKASADLGAALAAARKGLRVDAVLIPLRRAYRHLQDAAGALPGFEMISFQHACCAAARPPQENRI
jgi:hypothetical protein